MKRTSAYNRYQAAAAIAIRPSTMQKVLVYVQVAKTYERKLSFVHEYLVHDLGYRFSYEQIECLVSNMQRLNIRKRYPNEDYAKYKVNQLYHLLRMMDSSGAGFSTNVTIQHAIVAKLFRAAPMAYRKAAVQAFLDYRRFNDHRTMTQRISDSLTVGEPIDALPF